MNFTVVNWNVAGSKHLKKSRTDRPSERRKLNDDLQNLIEGWQPHVVTLQEVVRYKEPGTTEESIVDGIEDYQLYSFSIFDSEHLSAQAAWDGVRRAGGWDPATFFAQENALLIRNDVPLARILDLRTAGKPVRECRDEEESYIEPVKLESGLYFGDRDTEPRMAVVAHFIFDSFEKPLDVFVVNTHLTTLRGEREGISQVEVEAERIRQAQLDIIFYGIVSRYNKWKRDGYPERGKPRTKASGEEHDRHLPVWVVAGDFNLLPNSKAYTSITRMNFMDVIKEGQRGTGSKVGNLTVDYIFAGPVFTSLDPIRLENGIANNTIDHTKTSSDHYPLCAHIPVDPIEAI